MSFCKSWIMIFPINSIIAGEHDSVAEDIVPEPRDGDETAFHGFFCSKDVQREKLAQFFRKLL